MLQENVLAITHLDRNLVFTNSGSLYELGTPSQGQPPFEHLATICWAFHPWGFGQALGVPGFSIRRFYLRQFMTVCVRVKILDRRPR